MRNRNRNCNFSCKKIELFTAEIKWAIFNSFFPISVWRFNGIYLPKTLIATKRYETRKMNGKPKKTVFFSLMRLTNMTCRKIIEFIQWLHFFTFIYTAHIIPWPSSIHPFFICGQGPIFDCIFFRFLICLRLIHETCLTFD